MKVKLAVAAGVLTLAVVTTIGYGFVFLPTRAATTCTLTVTNTNASGAGSLTAAISSANASSSVDGICFNIAGGGVKTITPNSGIILSQPATIDGTTQPGYSGTPLIEISGQNVSGNGTPGVWITSSNSTVRGLVINRSKGNGIMITNGSNNTVAGNYIGTDATGTTALPNSIDGIGMITANNTIGGTTATDRNVISGNTANGIGITNQDAQNNTIVGNYVGTNKDGTGALPNGGDAILINNSTHNTIGGTTGTTPGGACTGACNLLSGNSFNGIGFFHADSNSIIGNYIGTTANGMGRLQNNDIGVELQEAASNTVGTGTANGRNVISGNHGAGILITGVDSIQNTIKGNYVGTDTTGMNPLGNNLMGISVGNSPGLNNGYARGNTIGGTIDPSATTCSGNCNLISGNGQNGIILSGGSSATAGTYIYGNYIGVRANGTGDYNGGVRNGLDGVGILNSPNNFIGNGAQNGRNIITGNGGNGVIIAGGSSTGNRIEYNYIGRSQTSGDPTLRIGNASTGIIMSGGISTAILGNSVTSNRGLGIDVGYDGLSQNDPGDGDGGVNNHQNFPDVYSAKNTDTQALISGTFNSNPDRQYRLDFFISSGCNSGKPNNFGEGEQFIGSTDIATDRFGNISFSYTHGSPLLGNNYITATATRKINGVPAESSEFSKCVLVNTSKPLVTNGASWYLKDDLTSGTADHAFNYGFPPNTLFCAWDPFKPGMKLPVVVTSGGTWYFRASYTSGSGDMTVQYGFPGGTPVCGDWNGDGIDTVGWVGGDLRWYLKNSNTGGNADMVFQYGPAGKPVVGDWDGNGTDGIGVFTPNSYWSLRNELNSGPADYFFQYGAIGVQPVVGDWDGNRSDTIGTYTGSGGYWSLRSANNSGPSTTSFNFGATGTIARTW